MSSRVLEIITQKQKTFLSLSEVEKAIEEQVLVADELAMSLSPLAVDALIKLQVLYYIKNGGIAGAEEAVSSEFSAPALKEEVCDAAAVLYLEYQAVFPPKQVLLPIDAPVQDLVVLQLALDGNKQAQADLASYFASLDHASAAEYWAVLSKTNTFEFVYESDSAASVVATGDFDGWTQSTVLSKDGSQFTGSVSVPMETITFKFVVDGVWTVSPSYPIVLDSAGIEINQLSVLVKEELPAGLAASSPEIIDSTFEKQDPDTQAAVQIIEAIVKEASAQDDFEVISAQTSVVQTIEDVTVAVVEEQTAVEAPTQEVDGASTQDEVAHQVAEVEAEAATPDETPAAEGAADADAVAEAHAVVEEAELEIMKQAMATAELELEAIQAQALAMAEE
ncbi:hypothetical protein HDU91_005980, partial [Kappamyces sp. JEL0680]